MNQKGSNFGTPDGYFDKFNQRLFERMATEQEIDTSFLPKSDGFRVPDAYFNSFQPKAKKGKVIQLSYLKWSAAVAAVVILMVFIFPSQLPTNNWL